MRQVYRLLVAVVILISVTGIFFSKPATAQALTQLISSYELDYSLNTTVNQSLTKQDDRVDAEAVPQITGIIPASASAGTNTEVTISGNGFGSNLGSVDFYFRQGQMTPGFITYWSDTLIKAVVPPVMLDEYYISASSGPITVTTAVGAASEGYPFAVTFACRDFRWPGDSPVVDFYVNPNTPDCTGEETAIQNAANTWNAVPDKSFTFHYAGTTTYEGSPSGASPNGVNDIYWRDLGVYGPEAFCVLWVSNNIISEMDIELNESVTWSTDANTPEGQYDVESHVLHEFGHGLSLWDLYGHVEGYPQDSESIMSGVGGPGVYKRILGAGDIAGMQWAYPSSTQSQYTINAVAGIGGSISPSGPVSVNRNTNQTFTITPDSGYSNAYVLIDNNILVTPTNYTFSNVTTNHTILATFIPSAPVTATFGLDSGNASYDEPVNHPSAMRFLNTAGPGTLTKLELLVDDTTPAGKVRMGVYADANGTPGDLLLDAEETDMKDGWVALEGLDLAVTEGEYYWLVFILNNVNLVRYQSGQPAGSHVWGDLSYGELPETFPAVTGSNANQYVMRATVTMEPPTTTPSVTTNPATGITDTFAILNGELADKGSASSVNCSFVWGTTPGGPYPDETNPALTLPETGPFSFNLADLSPDTEYFYRAKAAGDGISYGEEIAFKTDPEGPAILWEKNYGSDDYDWGNSVLQTPEGGYLVTATKYRDSAGYSDVWIIKTDSSGNPQWDKTFGTLWGDYGVSALRTADNGYIIGYYSYPGDWDVLEFSLVKTDSEGNKQWEKAVDATDDDYGLAFIQTTDGGYAIVGSYGHLFLDNYGELLLIKTNSSGDTQWYKTFDGPNYSDRGYSVIQSADGGYVVAGRSGGDEWLIKTDSGGNLQWSKTFSDMGAGFSIIPAVDDGYIIAGNIWLQKIDLNGNEQWRKNLNQADANSISICPTSDGGYIINGSSWLLKTDVNGNEQWNKTLAGNKYEVGNSVIQATDGSYVVTGRVFPTGAARSDVYLAKVEGALEATVDLSVGLQGGSRPDSGYAIPLTVKFFTPGLDIFTAIPSYTYTPTTAKSGGLAAAQCTGIAPGTYDITVVSEHTLLNVKRDVSITSPSTSLDMGTLLEGNVDNNTIIDISDFGILALAFNKSSSQPGYDARADFDRNGIVDISDFGLLAVNFNQISPVTIP